jgi:hypothetical protein
MTPLSADFAVGPTTLIAQSADHTVDTLFTQAQACGQRWRPAKNYLWSKSDAPLTEHHRTASIRFPRSKIFGP